MTIRARRAHGGRAARTAIFRRGLPAAALLGAAGAMLITGCAGAGATGAASASSPGGQRAAVAVPGSVPSAGPVNGAAAGTGQQAGTAVALAPASQGIVYTATLTVRVRAAMTAAGQAVSEVVAAGGYTAGEQAQAARSGERPQVSLTLKVPVTAYAGVLARLGRLGRATALTQQAQDVTQQVADVNSRVTSQEAEIAQLRALLGRAGSVSDLLQVQDQLSSDESALEALQAQQRALDQETSYATITLLLLGPQPRAAVRTAARHSFGAGLAAGWRGLAHATAWVLTALGAVLPFAVVLAMLAGLGWAGRRRMARLARRRSGPPAEPAA
jgi:hypothetical protein